MELQHVSVKVLVEGELNVPQSRLIEVFHRWIRDSALDEMLIDVADYRHVPAGPSVLLVGSDSDYCLDNRGNRYGLRYSRKSPLDGSNGDRISQAFSSAARACLLLEDELASEGPLRFSRREFELVVNDRALAPNSPETFEACRQELEAAFERLLGHRDFRLNHQSDPRCRFGVDVTVAQPCDLAAIAQAVA